MVTEMCACGTRFAVGLLRCPRCQTLSPLHTSRARGVVASPVLPERVSGSSMPELEPSFKQLRAVAKSLGLSAGGTADELKARIAAAQGGDPS